MFSTELESIQFALCEEVEILFEGIKWNDACFFFLHQTLMLQEEMDSQHWL